MSESNFESVVSVLPVKDHPVAVAWYQKWIGRVPDSEPTEGVSEWLLAENAWIQVSLDPEPAGQTTEPPRLLRRPIGFSHAASGRQAELR